MQIKKHFNQFLKKKKKTKKKKNKKQKTKSKKRNTLTPYLMNMCSNGLVAQG